MVRKRRAQNIVLQVGQALVFTSDVMRSLWIFNGPVSGAAHRGGGGSILILS
jgi:hypothetical protein